MAKKVSKDELDSLAQEAAAQLPPAGHKRDEELRKREDTLAQAVEEAAGDNVMAIDPNKIAPDRELQAACYENVLSIPHAKWATRAYCWARIGMHGTVNEARRDGWQLVQGLTATEEFPECPEYRDENGYVKVGDLVLMWMDRARWVELRKAKEAQEDRKYDALKEHFQELGEEIVKRTGGKLRTQSIQRSRARAEAIGARLGGRM